MELPVLKQTGSNTYIDILEKLDEETFEVEMETHNGTKKDLAAEYFDVIQTCIRGLDKLREDGIDIEEVNQRDIKKLLDRGWKYKNVISIEMVWRD